MVVLFAPTAWFGFVNYDDTDYVVQNEHVNTGFSLENLKWSFNCGYSSNWHPGCWWSLMFDAEICRRLGLSEGVDPSKADIFSAGHDGNPAMAHIMHVHNVLLHACNAVLLFLLLVTIAGFPEDERGTGENWRDCMVAAALLALLWSVHPLRCEVVCWISERKELLCVFWMLLAMLAWTGGRKIFVFPCFLAALLCKPVAVTLPVTLFAWDWLVKGRNFWRTALSVSPFMALSAAVSVVTVLAQDEAIAMAHTYTVPHRMAIALFSPIVYLWQMVWPTGLTPYYADVPIPHWVQIACGAAFLAGLVWIFVLGAKKRGKCGWFWVFGAVWAYVALLPMLGIIKVGAQEHSDRYTYWAGCGLCAMVMLAVRHHGAAMALVCGRKQVFGALIALLAVLAFFQSRHWRDSYTLFSYAVPIRCHAEMCADLAERYAKRGREGVRRGEAMLRESLAQNRSEDAYALLAEFLARHREEEGLKGFGIGGDVMGEAEYFAEIALGENPRCACAWRAKGFIALRREQYADSVRFFEKAIELDRRNHKIASFLPGLREKAAEAARRETGSGTGKVGR